MRNNFCFRAQSTVEYLVIISVIIVIALIVVGLFTNITSSNIVSVGGSSEKVGDISTGGISIVESVADSNGDSLILISNNSSDGITLKKISVGDVENSYDAVISGLDSKSISLDGLESVCPCESGKRNTKCEFKFEYLTGNKVTKVEYRTVSVECVNRVVASNASRVVNPIVEEVVLEDGTSAHPWIINNCLELQDMNQHLDGNYILGNDIDCDGVNFEPIGTMNYCETDLYGACTDETTCERQLSCEATWWTGETGCDTEWGDLCQLEQSICEGSCGGSWSTEDGGYCYSYTEVNCNTNSSLCSYCAGNWNVKDACNDLSCLTQETCERGPYGCGSTWIESEFAGNLDGNYKKILNLRINEPSKRFAGLFGYIRNGTVISNIGLEDVNIIGLEFVGSIAGYSGSEISNSYATGVVRALGGSGSSAGGIVGRQYDNPISNSYFNGNVYGPVWAGGISGYLDGTITNSYSTGLVNCSYAVGGIVAIIDNGASISNSFTTSSVIGSLNKKGIASVIWSGSINSSYWDTYLTGQSTCFKDISSVDRNTGCVSTNNSASSYYGSNGIPFDNLNWSTSIWTSRANNYPVLSWQ